jgi:hypothetical protein
MKIAYCQLTYKLDVEEAIENVKLVYPYVNKCIVVFDQTLNAEQINELRKYAILRSIVWDKSESVVQARNDYLNLARDLGYDWIVASDPDEHYDIHFLQELKTLVEKADNEGYNCLRINVKDYFTDDEHPHLIDCNFWKVLLIKCESNIYIDGAGITKNRHEITRGNIKMGTLPTEYFYVHKRSHSVVLERAFRNIYVAGGGDGFGRTNPLYVELKNITDSLNINLWYEIRDYMIKGNIDDRLKKFIIDHRSDYDEKWKEEFRDTFRWYFEFLHPEENIHHFTVASPPDIRRSYAEQVVWDGYLNLLKREPDEDGYKNYLGLIKRGVLNKESFENILANSDEYRNQVTLR